MASNTVTVNIVGDASRLKSALGESNTALGGFQRSLRSFGDSAQQFGKTMSTHVTAPLAILAGLSFRELAKSGQVAAQTAAAIRSTGGEANVTAEQIDKLGNSLLRKSGTDDEAIKSGENLLLTFTNIRNEAGKGNDIFNQATEAALDLSVAFGKDMTDSAILVGKALQDPIAGVSALRRVGVQLSEQQKESIKTFVEQGDIMSAQKVILAELTKEVGGSAEAYGKTMAGQVAIAKEELLNAGAAMLTVAAPAVVFLSEKILGLSNFLTELSPATKVAVTAFAGFIALVGPVSYLIGSIAKGAAGLVSAFGLMAKGAETIGLKALYAADGLKAMSLSSALAMGAVTLGFAAAVAGAIYLGTRTTDLSRAFDRAKDSGRQFANEIIAVASSSGSQFDDLKKRLEAVDATIAQIKSSSGGKALAEGLGNVSFALKDQQQAAMHANLDLTSLTETHDILTKKLKELKAEQVVQDAQQKATTDSLHQYSAAVAAGGSETGAFTKLTEDGKKAIQEFQSELLAAAGGEIGHQQQLINIARAQEEYNTAVRDYGEQSPQAIEKQLDLNAAQLQGASQTDQLEAANRALIAALLDGTISYDAQLAVLQQSIRDHPENAAGYQLEIDKLNDAKAAIDRLPAYVSSQYEVIVDANLQPAIDAMRSIGIEPSRSNLEAFAQSIVPVFRASKGGLVPGVGDSDSVPTMLTPGEFVVSKDMMRGAAQMPASIGAAGGGGIQIETAYFGDRDVIPDLDFWAKTRNAAS